MAAGGTHWSSRFGFLMASVGFAVGLGNIWRFPYVTGENGGSAFVLVYLLCAFGIGVPILMAEVMLGRLGRLSPPGSIARVAELSGSSPRWAGFGYLNLLAAFSILIAYGVVAGWVLLYFVRGLTGDIAVADAALAQNHFDELLASVPTLLIWTVVAMSIAGAIVYAGVQKGIERAVVILMPLLFLLMVGLAIFNAFAGGMGEALAYLFVPDFSKLGPETFLAAVGQAFFSIGVGMAGMMVFGAYLPQSISISRSVIIIVLADTGVALLAGLVIFPMVFNNGLDPAGGAGLIFQTLPVAFAGMTGGPLVGTLFFLLLSVAAITSVVGLVEPLVAWLDERFALGRHKATVVLISCVLAANVVSILSYNHWAEVTLFGQSLAALIDYVPNQLFLPIGGLCIALFVGWFVQAQASRQELAIANPAWFTLWHQLLRFVVVPAIAVILITGVAG